MCTVMPGGDEPSSGSISEAGVGVGGSSRYFFSISARSRSFSGMGRQASSLLNSALQLLQSVAFQATFALQLGHFAIGDAPLSRDSRPLTSVKAGPRGRF